MKIHQFEDRNLAHFSYAIESGGEIALIDPARNPQPYYEFARVTNGKIVAVIETHPHADFVSSHLEIAETTGARIHVSELLGAYYPHETFDEGKVIRLGKVKLKAINTPGHSADSITILLEDENGKDYAAFTGDTLFLGDCGRPDLREKVGNIQQKRRDQAAQMYRSLQKLLRLNDDVLVYPTHGAGSLCGKGLSSAKVGTIGGEKQSNWSLQPMGEDAFVAALTEGQPFIPKYFGFDVETNRKGANAFRDSVEKIHLLSDSNDIDPKTTIIDTRAQELFRRSHLPNSINIPNELQFETWLGSIISPQEQFYLTADDEITLRELVSRTAKIGYESLIKGAFVFKDGSQTQPTLNLNDFRTAANQYTIVDVRSKEEARVPIFESSINIPLDELRERTNEIPTGRPIIVHCAGGYRSAAGSSIIKKNLNGAAEVFDLSESVKEFQS